MMLEKYCRDNNFTIKEVYIDDGYLGLNLYAYYGNNPVNYYDPSGRIAISTLII